MMNESETLQQVKLEVVCGHCLKLLVPGWLETLRVGRSHHSIWVSMIDKERCGCEETKVRGMQVRFVWSTRPG